MKIKDVGEIGIIKRMSKSFKMSKSVIKGPGDDTAVVEWTKDKYMLLTCDMLIENVHFTRKTATPFQVGWKAMARNISDIAAMGGEPKYALVSVALPKNAPVSLADGIARGLAAAADKFGVSIVGGDLSHADKIMIDVSLTGEVEKKNLVTRSGARKGDVILVTGALGGSIKGRHLDFIPRVEEARRLVRSYDVNSMIDISDGLELDLWRILKASGKGARIYESLIPVSKAARSFEDALTDGEDFELLFTMNVGEAKKLFKKDTGCMKTPVTLIGEVTDKDQGYKLITDDGDIKKMGPKGYLHF